MIKTHKFYYKLSWLFLAIGLPLPFVILLKTGLPLIFQDDFLKIAFGLVGYVWMLAVVYISTKPKWLDNLIGLSEAYMIHGMLAVFALLALYVHKFMIPSVGLIKTVGDVAIYIYTTVIAYSLIMMAGWLTNRVSLLMKIKRFIEKLFKHEINVWLHRANVVATIGGYVHVCLIDYVRNTMVFALLTVYFAFVMISYAVYVIRRKGCVTGKVVEVKPLGSKINQLVVEIPEGQLKRYRAGDFVFISFSKKGLEEPHPFSLENDPLCEKHLVFAIEEVGDFTRLIEDLKEGDAIYLSCGYGLLNRIFSEQRNDSVVVITGGMGVVPLIGLMERFKEKECFFLHTVSEGKDMLYEHRFNEWEQRYTFTSFRQKGRFSHQQLKECVPIGRDYCYILAGPMKMNLSYKKYLISRGVGSEQIYYESFNF